MKSKELIAKALSTTSEEEAFNCIRIARKRGVKLSDTTDKSSEKNHKQMTMNAIYWREMTVIYKNGYDSLKKKFCILKKDHMKKENKINRLSSIFVVSFTMNLILFLLLIIT